MNDHGAPKEVAIRRLSILAASPVEARRLADALPAALERALAPADHRPRRSQPADRVAAAIVARIAMGEGQRS